MPVTATDTVFLEFARIPNFEMVRGLGERRSSRREAAAALQEQRSMAISIEIDIPPGAGHESAIKELEKELSSLPEDAFSDIWVSLSGFPSFGALTNSEHAFLMFFRFGGDPGFVSSNPFYDDGRDEMVQFELANGQVDEYPLDSCYPTARAKEALLHFARTGDVPDWMQWLNASGDGNQSPNDPFDVEFYLN